MAQGAFSRSAALAALIAILGIGACDSAVAIEPPAPTIQVVGSDASSRFVPLGVGKSVVIELPRDIKDVLVADPKITNVVVRTARRVYLIGIAVGQTNVLFFDADGKQIAGFDIAVTRDLNGVRMAIKQVLPDSDIRMQSVADGIMLDKYRKGEDTAAAASSTNKGAISDIGK